MIPTLSWLLWVCAVAGGAYLLSGAVLIGSRVQYERRQRVMAELTRILTPESQPPDEEDVRRRALNLLSGLRLETLARLAPDVSAPAAVQEAIGTALLARLGESRLKELARTGGARRRVSRRIAALRAQVASGADAAIDSLALALETAGSIELKAAAVTLLRQVGNRPAARVLLDALERGVYSGSRLAAALEAMPVDTSDLVAPLLASPDRLVRFWATTLMHRYPDRVPPAQVQRLVNDPEPIVRKAAIDILLGSNANGAEETLRECLVDRVPFVRAHAARSLGSHLGGGAAGGLLPLLGDPSWVVRDAAKAALEAMGPGIASDVVPFLSHADAFARNGAAEVLQNTGFFERLLVLESEAPADPERQLMVLQLAQAGGARMWEIVLDRLPAAARVEARRRFASVGLEATFAQAPEASAQGGV